MQHGEILVRLSLSGEPQKLLTYWRGSMRDMVPSSAAVTILKLNKKPPRTPWWSDYDPNFYFELMTRTEKKRAELGISDRALSMTALEIETAHLQRDSCGDRRRRRVLQAARLRRLLGLVPRQISTGNRTILGKISKRGKRDLRVLFVQAAWVVLIKPNSWISSNLRSITASTSRRRQARRWSDCNFASVAQSYTSLLKPIS